MKLLYLYSRAPVTDGARHRHSEAPPTRDNTRQAAPGPTTSCSMCQTLYHMDVGRAGQRTLSPGTLEPLSVATNWPVQLRAQVFTTLECLLIVQLMYTTIYVYDFPSRELVEAVLKKLASAWEIRSCCTPGHAISDGIVYGIRSGHLESGEKWA